MPSLGVGEYQGGTQGFLLVKQALTSIPSPVVVWLYLAVVSPLGLVLCCFEIRKERPIEFKSPLRLVTIDHKFTTLKEGLPSSVSNRTMPQCAHRDSLSLWEASMNGFQSSCCFCPQHGQVLIKLSSALTVKRSGS